MNGSQNWEGTIRKLWVTENNKFRDHLLRLDADSRRLRFGHMVGDDFIVEYANRSKTMAGHSQCVIYGGFVDGEMIAAAELRKLGEVWAPDAEAAFSVESAYQDTGIGTLLMGRLIRSARNRKIQHIYMNCLVENGKMQRIAKKYEADLHFEYGSVIGDVVPEGPSYLSLWQEAVDDRYGFVMAVLNLPHRIRTAA